MKSNYDKDKDINTYKDIDCKSKRSSNTLANKILELRVLTDSKGVIS